MQKQYFERSFVSVSPAKHIKSKKILKKYEVRSNSMQPTSESKNLLPVLSDDKHIDQEFLNLTQLNPFRGTD